MTHKKIFRVLALAAFVAMVVIAPLQAAPNCGKPGCKGDQEKMMAKGCGMEQGCMMLKNIPNLTDEQKAKLEKLHAEHQAMMAAAMADMQKKMQAHHEAVRALLTDEQKAKLPEMGGCGKMQGMGCCKMAGEHKPGADCKMKKDVKADHSKCQKAAEEKKEEKK